MLQLLGYACLLVPTEKKICTELDIIRENLDFSAVDVKLLTEGGLLHLLRDAAVKGLGEEQQTDDTDEGESRNGSRCRFNNFTEVAPDVNLLPHATETCSRDGTENAF
ncbi:hypothetical protein GBF38_005376 [Nibea albiflora]|uniref:Uncharacterized protein n=1 Tax=Nibea albiflora TaxID=240163 RepID=A0ACB7EVD3_NIBAL|nr:hypothetical protein GBF38_005376 [Nibea albiflora]